MEARGICYQITTARRLQGVCREQTEIGLIDMNRVRGIGQFRLAAALLLLLVPTVPRGSAIAQTITRVVRVSGSDPYETCPPAASHGGVEYANTAVEPQIAVNPTSAGTDHVNLVGVWQQDRWSDGGAQGIVAAYSSDGGQTWTETSLPFSACGLHGFPSNRASDPWVSIGPDGTVYASALEATASSNGAGVNRDGVAVSVSHDGGGTWSPAHIIPGSVGGGDGVPIVAETGQPDVAYAVWGAQTAVHGRLADVIPLARTTNGGQTWSKPRPIVLRSPGHQDAGGVNLLVNPRTHWLYDIARIFGPAPVKRVCKQVRHGQHPKGRRVCHTVRFFGDAPQFLAVSVSKNGGLSWSRSRVIARVHRARIVTPVRAEGFQDAALDPASGRLYVLWEDARFRGGTYEGLVLSSSDNGGMSWTKPQNDRIPAGQELFAPSISVNARGVVGVSYYTIPPLTGKPKSLPAAYWFVASHDHGTHFSAPVHLAGPFELTAAPIPGAHFLGDYQGHAAANSFYAFFAVSSFSSTGNRTDVYVASVLP